MTEQEALDAYRRAIAATDEAEWEERRHRNSTDLQRAVALAEDAERLAARTYLAARDAATARQVTCSAAGPCAADFEGDE